LEWRAKQRQQDQQDAAIFLTAALARSPRDERLLPVLAGDQNLVHMTYISFT